MLYAYSQLLLNVFRLSVDWGIIVFGGQNCCQSRGQGLDPVKHVWPTPSTCNLLLTVPMRYFCCSSSMLHCYMLLNLWVYGLPRYGHMN